MADTNRLSASTDVGGIVRIAGRADVKFVLAAGLVFYFTYHLTGFHLSRIWPLVPTRDVSLMFDRAREIFARGDYPARLQTSNVATVFPYSPSAVLLFRGLEICGPRAFMVAWIVLMGGGLIVTFRASVAGESDEMRSAWLALGAASLVFSDSPVSWDIRLANSNLVYLGLVLAGYGLLHRRPWFAGALVGLSISLKVYSGLLVPWLLVHGPRRALYSTVITLVLLWLLLPIVLFGPDGTIKLYSGWHDQLRIISDAWVYSVLAVNRYGPPLVTLRRSVMSVTGAGPDSATTRLLVLLLWAIWLAGLLWYAGRAFSGRRVVAPSRAALADWTILMLAPLPFSPWLEPYHAVPVVPGTILCLAIAFDERLRSRERIISAVALSALLALHLVGPPFRIRGLGLLAQFAALLIAFGSLRPCLDRLPITPEGLNRRPLRIYGLAAPATTGDA